MSGVVLSRFNDKWLGEPNSGCWLWMAVTRGKYGLFWRNGVMASAHRASWELHRGPIPDGLDVLHQCDTPACVNPAHLRLGTHADNMRDRDAKGRHVALRGESNGLARLTEADAVAIRADRRTGTQIANDYGVCEGTIKSVRARRTWRHV